MDLRSTEQSSKKHNHPDTEKIFSDADFDILKTAENRVRTSVFLLSEPSLDFKNRLREKIRAARHSQSHRSLKQWSIEFFKPFFRLPQWRPVLAMVVVIALVITSVQIWPLWHSSQSTHLSRLLIDTAYAQDNFEVVPTKTDQVGLATDSAFTVTSKQAVDVGILRKNITVVPAIDFDFQKVSDHEFKIIPRQPLLDKTVYRVYINSSYVGMNGIIIDRPFSWVFQVRDQFSLTSNIPRNFATDVPVTTGIELQFSRADFEDYEHYISFSPALSGHFEKKGKIVTFIPNQALKPATIYTVTLKPGLPVQNSTDKLLKGSSIAFETAPTLSPDQPASYLNVADNFVQFTPEQTPFLEIFSTIPEHQSVRLEVFSLSTAQDFSRAYLDEEKGINSWSKYNHQVPVDQSAFPVTRVTTTLEYFNHRSYVVLPSKLAAGWYLARITGQGETSYAFIQSTYLATYGVVSSNKVLVWLHNLKNHEPLSGATLYNPENHVVMTSDRQGIATIETAQLFSATSTASTSLHSLLVQNNGEQAVMMLNRPDPSKENSGYWNYLSTDRTIYQPTDQLYFWGMIQPRSNTTSTPPTITVRLTGGNTSEAIVEKIVPLDQGFFKGTVNLEQLQPGYYELQLFSNGNTLGQSRYLTIARSVKPAYQITVTPDKPVAYMGESLTYRIAASFFDGTPVAYLPVKYGTSPSDTLKLDATGQGTITIPTAPYPCRENKQCSRSYYDSKELEVTPLEGNDAAIVGRARVTLLGSDLRVSASTTLSGTSQAQVMIQTDHVIPGADPMEYGVRDRVFAQIPLQIIVKEVTYTSVPDREEYDFITKRTVQYHRYEPIEKQIGIFNGTSNADGQLSYTFPTQPDKTYRIEIFGTDQQGRVQAHFADLFSSAHFYAEDDEYALRNSGNSTVDAYSLEKKVILDLAKNGTKISDPGSYLFYRAQRGLIDFSLSSSSRYSFTFDERVLPNVYVGGVWFDGTAYHGSTDKYGSDLKNITFDPQNDRAITLAITADKENYQPGDSVHLHIHSTDNVEQPVMAHLLVKVVDEAYYAEEDAYSVSTILSELYRSVESGISEIYSSHKYSALSAHIIEGGYGGGEGNKVRSVFPDVALFKDITTDKLGNADITFTIPDTITSWRVTAEALSQDLHAGVTSTPLHVSLPLFVTMEGGEYLTTDKPLLKAWVQGKSLHKDDLVNLVFTAFIPEAREARTITAFRAEYFTLPPLLPGEHTVQLAASTNQYSDSLARTISVRTSRESVPTHVFTSIKPGQLLSGSTTQRTRITFTDQSRGKVYDQLLSLGESTTDRIDDRSARLLAQRLRIQYFNEATSTEQSKEVWLAYQTTDGGISLLPYSSSDLEISAHLAITIPQMFDQKALKKYFENVVNDPNATKQELAYAYAGLATLGSPILTSLKSYLTIPDLTVSEKLYALLALYESGDTEMVSSYFTTLINQYGVSAKPYTKLTGGENEGENTTLTAWAAVLAAHLNLPVHEQLEAYVTTHSTTGNESLRIQKAAYAEAILPQLTSQPGSFTLNNNGQNKEYHLSSGGVVSLSVTPNELSHLSVVAVQGNVGSVSEYENPETLPTSVKNSSVALKREFLVNGLVTTTFKESDLVEVRLYPTILSGALDTRFQIVDYVPSGLRIITPEYASSLTYEDGNVSCNPWYPYEINGQLVKYSIGKDWQSHRTGNCTGINYISYYARVVSPGIYSAEPAGIFGFTATTIRNYSPSTTVTITY